MGASAASQPSLQPDAGQYFTAPLYAALDTRTGRGTTSANPLAAGATIKAQITGVDGVPAGISAVVVDIAAIGPAGSGYLTAWDSDSSDLNVPSVGVAAGVNSNQTDTIPVGGSGSISVTNHSSGSLNLQVVIAGYYSGAGTSAAGSTFVGLPWSKIADSSTGTGTSNAPIPAGGSRTIQVGGQGGIPTTAGIAVLQVNAFGVSGSGYLSVYPAGTSDPNVGTVDYAATGPTIRNLFYAPLSASGQITLTNWGSTAVGFTVYTHGYFLPASASPAGGKYWSFDPDMLLGTASAGTALAAGATMSFQVGGDDDIPSTGVSEVAEQVIVTNASAAGQLWAGNSSTELQPVVSFPAGNGTRVGYDQTILIQVSGDGQETISNSSAATVDVQVAAVGDYQAPHSPGSPDSVSVATSGTTATVSWAAPDTDGGSPVTGYTVTSSPDAASATVSAGTHQAVLTGLTNASTDLFSVTAANAAGTGAAGTAGSAAQTVTGTVTMPSGAPLAGATVTIEDTDPPSTDPASWTPDTLGTATTGANGQWSFTVPTYGSLPAGAQQAATNDGGYLDVDAYASGSATVGSNQYPEVAVGNSAAWVGTASQATTQVPSQQTPLAMTTKPIDVTDDSGWDTLGNESNTGASLNSPTITDSNGNFTGNGENAYPAVATDAYGYQEIGGNGTYDPYIAADGTNLSTATVTPDQGGPPCHWTEWVTVSTGWGWTAVGEQHAYRDATGSLTFTTGGSTSIEVAASYSGGAWSVSGSAKWTANQSFSTGITAGPMASYINVLALNYEKQKRNWACTSGIKGNEYEIVHLGVHSEPGNSNWNPYKLGPSVLSEDGPTAYKSAIYKSSLYPNQKICNTKGSSFSYGDGVTVYGIGLKTTVEETASTQQCITEGSSRKIVHHVWGGNNYIWNDPRRFFSD
jgi:hypothetical protein